MHEAICFGLRHFTDRNACPAGNNLGNILFIDHVSGGGLLLAPCGALHLNFLTEAAFLIPQGSGTLKVLMGNGILLFGNQGFQLLFLCFHIRRCGKSLNPHTGGGFVH